MQAGDILLFKGEAGLAKLIQWGTGSKYSHVAVCVSPEMNLAIESMAGGGVRGRDVRGIWQEYDVYRIKEGNVYDLDKMVSYLVSKLNNKYDYKGVIFLGLLKLLDKIGIPLKNTANKWQKDRDYFCSELCCEAFKRGGGFNIVPDVLEADITSPGDIAQSAVVELVL